MATHSSVLAWRIPGTGEPGGLQSLGSHRVGHDWSDLAAFGLRCRMWDLFSCSMWTLSLWHVGSGSLTTDQTQAPCTGSRESQLLDHQRSPFNNFTKVTLHINLLLDPAIPLLKIYPNDIMVEIQKGTYTRQFITAPFIIALGAT